MSSSGSHKAQSPVGATGSMIPAANCLREVFLEKYFQMLSDFNYDQARERAERERDLYKTIVSSWTMLVHALVHLVTDEKAYMSLSFLGPKWFTRPKDSLRHSYHTLINEFRKIRETLHLQAEPLSNFDALLAHLCEQLEHFPMARLRTMDLYEQLTTIGSNRNFNYEDPVMVGREIVAYFQKSFHHPLLSPIKASFNLECDVIQHLLTTQILISELDYLPALLQLHQAHTKLASWGSCLPAREERVAIVLYMAELQSVTAVQRRWKLNVGPKPPTHTTILNMFRKFKDTGSVLDAPRSGRPSLEPEKVDQIKATFENEPSTSIRKASVQLDLPYSTIRETLKYKMGFKTFHHTIVQELFPDDCAARYAMCTELKQVIEGNVNNLHRLCFSDEATFYVSGKVNKHNTVIWATENPREIIVKPIKSPGVTVWGAMFNNKLIGPYFFDGSVNGHMYLDMLKNYFIPQLKNCRFSTTTFQQDGAPCHWALEVRHFLNANFPGRWIGRNGPMLWAPRSPDLTTMDFFLWGFMKDRVYSKKPRNVE